MGYNKTIDTLLAMSAMVPITSVAMQARRVMMKVSDEMRPVRASSCAVRYASPAIMIDAPLSRTPPIKSDTIAQTCAIVSLRLTDWNA